MLNSSPYVRLIEQVCISIEKIGVEKTIDCLNQGIKSSSSDNVHSKFILDTISQTLNISTKEILHGTGRKNSRAYAVGFACYYLHYVFHYEMNEVKKMLNKNVWVCYKYSDKIKQLNPNHISDKKYIEYRSQIDKAVTEFNNGNFINKELNPM